MEYKIAICDDSSTDAEFIASFVKEWAKVSKITVSLETFSSAESFFFHYEEEKDYDILLLDIEMGNMNGVELARRIRTKDKEMQIVFITGYNDYIADGYDVEALHYLLKPVHQEKLTEILNRACEKLAKNEAALFVNLPDGMIKLFFNKIRYIEVRANYVTFHETQEITVKTTLSSLEEKLDDSFFRVGRSYIVNMRYIRKITKKEVILENGEAIPLSRGCYKPLNQAFIHYF